ncbi:MAG: FlgD immunoglobulin-like domain containing protein [Candidatus Eisenbacteria bacterium]
MPRNVRHLIAAAALAMLALPPALAQAVDVAFSVTSTYLHPDRIDSPPSAVAVPLAPLGISPGMVLDMRSVGDWNNGPNGDILTPLMVVFSSSNTLLGRNERYRVPGALGVGRNVVTVATCPSNDSLDIPQDFSVDTDTTIVTVPAGAAYLFVATADCYWVDNSDPDADLRLRLTPLGLADVPAPPVDGAQFASPNPFVHTTTVRFTLPHDGDADVRVYDVAGRLRRTLRSGRMAAGVHAVTFDGLDDEHRPLPRGTYFVRIADASGARTLKVTRVP